MLLRHCCCVAYCFDNVAVLGNNVEATFDIVEATFDIVAFDNVASTLLLVWTGLYEDQHRSVAAAIRKPPRDWKRPAGRSKVRG